MIFDNNILNFIALILFFKFFYDCNKKIYVPKIKEPYSQIIKVEKNNDTIIDDNLINLITKSKHWKHIKKFKYNKEYNHKLKEHQLYAYPIHNNELDESLKNKEIIPGNTLYVQMNEKYYDEIGKTYKW